MGEKGVRYRDEVWTGIEYQVATNMIYEDMISEGLSIVKGVHDRYNGEKHNPWNEIECGDHYARAMASWGVMIALEDFYYNGPEGVLGFNPKIGAENFKGFFTAAQGWGNLEQSLYPAGQTNKVILKYGRLRLKQLEIKARQSPSKVIVTVDGKIISNRFKESDGKLKIDFDEQEIYTGQTIEVKLSY
jgi:non-lysosomal glucosylceramidase